ncbi:hypothetical protein [Staphylococcus aureus]|nr:hypothetical protein [Staphylococcus aureus]MCS5345689.1 hypothetical protein [Staphylococcus aureus]
MYRNWGRELQSIIENMDTKDVKEVMGQASKSYITIYKLINIIFF